MSERRRTPEVGDLVIQKYDETPSLVGESSNDYVGIVFKTWRQGYRAEVKNVYICWQGDGPPYYREYYGIPEMNVHNLDRKYLVIKADKNITRTRRRRPKLVL